MSLMHRAPPDPLWVASSHDRRPVLVIGAGAARPALLAEIEAAGHEIWCEDELYAGIDAVLSDPRGWSAVLVLADALDDPRGARLVRSLLSLCDPAPRLTILPDDAPEGHAPCLPLRLAQPAQVAEVTPCSAANRPAAPQEADPGRRRAAI